MFATLFAPGCGRTSLEEQSVSAGDSVGVNEAAARSLDPEPSIGTEAGSNLPVSLLFSAERSPDAICSTDGWRDATAAVMNETGHESAPTALTSTGRGCRAVSTIADREVDIRIEIVDRAFMADAAATRGGGAEDIAPDLMGFEEVSSEVTGSVVASSLLHPKLDRVEEHRWIAVDGGGAFHLAVAVEPAGSDLRSELAGIADRAATGLEAVVADHNRTGGEGEPEGVAAALEHVLTSIIDGRPLDDDSTPTGLEAISFEYAFPENIAAIAPYRDDVACDQDAATAECRIEALSSVYRFTFVDDGGSWLLDDFRVDG